MTARTYHGSCHCGVVKFTIITEPITKGCRCNCSICRRKGAVLSDVWFSPDEVKVDTRGELGLYRFGDRDVNHWFCKTCGIFPFSELSAKPGNYRVNLGCVEGLDPLALELRLIDGAAL
jgi:hypothetical protein